MKFALFAFKFLVFVVGLAARVGCQSEKSSEVGEPG
jgi:hypothetical protein